ncbi:MAG: hypothetical protein R2932_26070 [Caldilineaceae bacterium]
MGGQLLAAAILIYSGVQVRVWGGWLDVAVTIIWIVGITNAMNLLDNMDGLSGGIGHDRRRLFYLAGGPQ